MISFKEFLPKFLKYAEHRRAMQQEGKRRTKALEIEEVELDPEEEAELAKIEKEEKDNT